MPELISLCLSVSYRKKKFNDIIHMVETLRERATC